MQKIRMLSLLLFTSTLTVLAGDFDQAAVRALGDVASYSHKAGYSAAVSDVYLGYDASGRPVAGVALRPIKTYATVTGLVAVKQKEGQWMIDSAVIPDIGLIKDPAKQQKVMDALKEFPGHTVKDGSGTVHKVDAVTGATRYQENIYLYFNLLAKTAVEEIEKNPDWPKTPVSK